eukprot:2352798-Amphidinium_carterae.1
MVQKHAQYLERLQLSWSRAASQGLYTHFSCALLKAEALALDYCTGAVVEPGSTGDSLTVDTSLPPALPTPSTQQQAIPTRWPLSRCVACAVVDFCRAVPRERERERNGEKVKLSKDNHSKP